MDAANVPSAEILIGGEWRMGGRFGDLPEHPQRAFYEPAVLTNLAHNVNIVQQEVFGPVVVALPYVDEDELVSPASGTVVGPAAGIWTGSFPRAWRPARRLRGGTVCGVAKLTLGAVDSCEALADPQLRAAARPGQRRLPHRRHGWGRAPRAGRALRGIRLRPPHGHQAAGESRSGLDGQVARARLLAATEPVEVLNGSVAEACARFPSSINVSAAIALATKDLDLVEVRIVADPAARFAQHRIEVSGPCSNYAFSFDNLPPAANPRTSAVGASSVLHAIGGLGVTARELA